LGNNGVYGAILIPAHQLWPAKLCWALQQECTKNKNVNIQSHTPVTKINRSSSGKWQVDTPRGTVICDVVLHASNAWSGALLPIDLQKALIPTRAQVIAFHSPQDKDIDVTQWTRGFSLHYGSEYMIRRRKDGVYVVGGGRENIPGQQMYENDDSILNRDVGKALRTFLNTHFPSLLPTNERSFQEWTGIMCYTYDGQPIVGHVPETPGQYVAVGYNGHGMPFAFQSGQFIADQASIFLTGSDADSKLISTQDLELIQQAWQMYNPQRFHQNGHEMTHEKAGESQGLNATNSIPTGPSNTPLARILRNKRYRHRILLVLAFLIVAQYSICCK
jgi:glycine/D-amino acid oxidase-like deaminating enzyme